MSPSTTMADGLLPCSTTMSRCTLAPLCPSTSRLQLGTSLFFVCRFTSASALALSSSMRVKMLLNNILESLMDLHYHKFYSLSFQEYYVRRLHIEHKRRSSIANQSEMKIKRTTATCLLGMSLFFQKKLSLDSSPPYHILQVLATLQVSFPINKGLSDLFTSCLD